MAKYDLCTIGDILKVEENKGTEHEDIGLILEEHLIKCFPNYERPIHKLCEKIWYDEGTDKEYCHRLINIENDFLRKGINKKIY